MRECPNGCGAKVTWARPSTTGRGYYAEFDLHDPYRRHTCGPHAALDTADPEVIRDYLDAAIELAAQEALREQPVRPRRVIPPAPPGRLDELVRERAAKAAKPRPGPAPEGKPEIKPVVPVKIQRLEG